MSNRKLIGWKAEFYRKRQELIDINDYLKEDRNLSESVLEEITVRQDQLMHDIRILRERILNHREEQNHE